MLYSADRMSYIIEYISSYKQKIEMANKRGLLDSAKMFELFAEEVCKLYYGIEFHNLNNICNFPYFDLISEDEKILVQVSTVTDIHQKIKKTLENVRDDEDNRFTKINSVYFFVLHNDSIKNVKNYTGKNQIGNISFIKEKNLITTEDIINRAQTDVNFQEQLYNLMKNDVENYNEWIRKFEEAIDISKNVGINNIETKINGEYEIDRKEFVDIIKNDNYRFISIQGKEGAGKTVICKKCIENEDIVLYARAERFLEENDIDRLYSLYQNYSDEEDYSRIVTLQEIRDKEYNLSPNRYVVYHKEEIRPYAEVLAEFKQAYEDVKRLENEFSLLINA